MKWGWLGICLLVGKMAFAAEKPYVFETPEQHQRYQILVKNFRCVTCQNQNLAESNAPVAIAMRDEIYDQLSTGRTDNEIEDFLVARYGEFVLYRPPLKRHTIVLWFAPFFIGVCALGTMIWTVRKKKEQ